MSAGQIATGGIISKPITVMLSIANGLPTILALLYVNRNPNSKLIPSTVAGNETEVIVHPLVDASSPVVIQVAPPSVEYTNSPKSSPVTPSIL